MKLAALLSSTKAAVLISAVWAFIGDGANTVEIGPQLYALLNNFLNALTVVLVIGYGKKAKDAHDTAAKVAEALPYVSIGRAHKVEEIINGEDH